MEPVRLGAGAQRKTLATSSGEDASATSLATFGFTSGPASPSGRSTSSPKRAKLTPARRDEATGEDDEGGVESDLRIELQPSTVTSMEEPPPEPTADVYSRVPVEAFGLAMLRGMGYDEASGKVGVGERAAKVEPYSNHGRPALLGLGAQPALMNGAGAANKPQFMAKGSVVRFLAGPLAGSFASVLQIDGMTNDEILVRTKEIDELKVPRAEIELIRSEELDKSEEARRFVRELESRSRRARSKPRPEPAEAARRDEGRRDRPMWLREGARVKVRDSSHSEYKSKAVIHLVKDASKRTCTLLLDSGRLVDDVEERQLQTVVPKAAGGSELVVVLSGSRRGKVGTILNIDRDRERLKVNITGTNEDKWFEFDDVAAYVRPA